MYKYISKLMSRSKVLNISFGLLLTLASTLLCLGVGLYLSAARSVRDMDAQFTTIALPDVEAIRHFTQYQIVAQGIDEFDFGPGLGVMNREDELTEGAFDFSVSSMMQMELLNNIEASVFRSGAVHMDARRYFGGYSPEIAAIHAPLGFGAPGNAGGTAAFIARVTDIEEHYALDILPEVVDGRRFVIVASAYVVFEVEEVLVLHSDIDAPSRFFVHFRASDKEGGKFFAEGGRYLIAGDFQDNSMRITRAGNISMPSMFPRLTNFMIDLNYNDSYEEVTSVIYTRDEKSELEWARIGRHGWQNMLTDEDFPLDVVRRYASEDFILPWHSLGEMSHAEALLSDMGDIFRNTVTATEKDTNRLNIITTSNMNSLLLFNQQRASIIDGRSFTQEEYESGARVAILPNVLARDNNLAVGDNFTLTLFEGDYRSTGYFNPNTGVHFRAWVPGGFQMGMRFSEPISFEVIGIYQPPLPNIADPHSIHLNTLFIPDNAFQGFPLDEAAWLDDRDSAPKLNVIIVPNGENEAFRASVNALIPGYGNFFRLYDQGYSVVRPAMENLLRNGLLILALCFAGWAVTVVVFCLFFVLRKRREAGLLYTIGIKKKDRFRWVFVQCACVMLIAQIIAFGLSMSFYGQILGFAVDTAFAQVPEVTAFADVNIIQDGTQIELDVLRSPLAVPLGIGAGLVVLLLPVGLIVKNMVKRRILDM